MYMVDEQSRGGLCNIQGHVLGKGPEAGCFSYNMGPKVNNLNKATPMHSLML